MSAVKHTPIASFSQDAVTLIDGEHRIHDLALAEALGFDRPRDIRKLIDRHETTLKTFGEVCATMARTLKNKDNLGGRPSKTYYLNEHQAVFLCTKSETANATALTIRIVETFVAVKRGQTPDTNKAPAALSAPPTLTNAQARTIQKLIRERWPEQDAREAAYGRLKDRFQVTRYRDIRRNDFDAAVDFITSEHPARTVTLTLPIGKPANTVDTRFAEQRIGAALFHAKKSAACHEMLRDDLKAVEQATSRALRTLSRMQSHGEHARLCAGRLLEKETEYAK